MAEAILLLEQEAFEDVIVRSANDTIELMLASMASQMQRRGAEPIPEDLLQQLRQTLLDHSKATLLANIDSLKLQAAAIYAQEFSRQELIRLRQLSSDPVMVKARERSAVIDRKFMALGAQTMRAAEPELEAKITRMVVEYIESQKGGDDRS